MNARRLSSPVFWLATLLLAIVVFVVITVIVPSGEARAVIANVLLWISTLAVVMTVITTVIALFRRIRGRAA